MNFAGQRGRGEGFDLDAVPDPRRSVFVVRTSRNCDYVQGILMSPVGSLDEV